GHGNARAGNAWLKWAFSEAAVLSAQKDERIGALLQRLASKLGKAKAYSACRGLPSRVITRSGSRRVEAALRPFVDSPDLPRSLRKHCWSPTSRCGLNARSSGMRKSWKSETAPKPSHS